MRGITKFIISAVIVSQLSLVSAFAAGTSEVVNAIPDIFIALIAVVGAITLFVTTRHLGGVTRQSFRLVTVGGAALAVAYFSHGAIEILGPSPILTTFFESCSLIGLILIAVAPYLLAKIVMKWHEDNAKN